MATAAAIHSVVTPTSMLGMIAAPTDVDGTTSSPYGSMIALTSAAIASRRSGSTRRLMYVSAWAISSPWARANPSEKTTAGNAASRSPSVRVTAATWTSIVGPSSAASESNWPSLFTHSSIRAGEAVRNVNALPMPRSSSSAAVSLITTASASSTPGSSPAMTIGVAGAPAVANVPVANAVTTPGASNSG